MQVNLTGHVLYCGTYVQVPSYMYAWMKVCLYSFSYSLPLDLAYANICTDCILTSLRTSFASTFLLSDFTAIIMVCQLRPCWSSRELFHHPLVNHFSQAAETKQRVKIHYTINVSSQVRQAQIKGHAIYNRGCIYIHTHGVWPVYCLPCNSDGLSLWHANI